MGVPKFYRWISERYPCLSEVLKEYQLPEFDNLYLDMNGIIHNCSHPEDDNPHFRITEEKIFQDIFHYIEVLFRIIKPKKVFFMAIDGVAPRAKMNQQRGRRFRSSKEAEVLINKAIAKGEILPSEDRFDSNCITPGTEFMSRLHEALKYFVVNKISTDQLWQKPRIILSGHVTPGEGEHKIMDFIRYEKSRQDFDPNTRHCLYGLDADLIMLGLTTHEPYFSLLREEVKFTGKALQKKSTAPEDTTFHLLHLSLLREYIDYEFASLKDKLPFNYNLENIIDDWVLMGFLVGNDFIPHLPHLHIHQDCLPLLWRNYMQILPSLDGYLNEGGVINLPCFEKYLVHLAQFDLVKFQEIYEDIKWLDGKKNIDLQPFEFDGIADDNEDIFCNEIGALNSNDAGILTATEYIGLKESGVDCLSSSDDEIFDNEKESFIRSLENAKTMDDPMLVAFIKFKKNYYMEKLKIAFVTDDVLEAQSNGYIKALQWILHYYYNGVQSWSWYYPFHYAPYLSDVKNFSSYKIVFEIGKPFLPYEQLMAVLPTASKKLLPEAFQGLMVNKDSPIIDYYPVNFETDLNGKQQVWEAVVLIPFIDEERLLNAMAPLSSKLTKQEIERNNHGPHMLYCHSNEITESYTIPNFPLIEHCYTKIVELPSNFFVLPIDKIFKGLCHEVDLNSFHLGFPTLKHISHEAKLRVGGVRVFQHASRNENMILTLNQKITENIDDVKELIGKSIFVGWPHIYEAYVVSVTNDKIIYKEIEGTSKVQKCIMNKEDSQIWHKEAETVSHKYFDRFGIETGETHILIYAKPMNGKRYICEKNGQVILEKQWIKTNIPFLYQTCLPNLAVKDKEWPCVQNCDQLFEIGSYVFLLVNPHYGCQGKVLQIIESKDVRIKVLFATPTEPDIAAVKRNFLSGNENYYQAYVMAQMLGINSHLFTRITGSIMMSLSNKDDKNNMNIGLNIKFNKTGREVPGYSKKNGMDWLYSIAVKDILADYIDKFPEIFDAVRISNSNDVYLVDNIFKENKEERVNVLRKYLKSLPSTQADSVPFGSQIVDEQYVKQLIEIVDNHQETHDNLKHKLSVRPQVLYRPLEEQLYLIADQSVTFELFDRVINIREGYSVPLGFRGTIIGINNSSKEQDVLYEIVFDNEFPGGLRIRSPANRAYRLPSSAVLNLSHGQRINKTKSKNMLQKQILMDKKSNDNRQAVNQNSSSKNLSKRVDPQNKSNNSIHSVKESIMPTAKVNVGRFQAYPPDGGFRFPLNSISNNCVTSDDDFIKNEDLKTESENFENIWAELQKVKNNIIINENNDTKFNLNKNVGSDIPPKDLEASKSFRVEVNDLFNSARAAIPTVTNTLLVNSMQCSASMSNEDIGNNVINHDNLKIHNLNFPKGEGNSQRIVPENKVNNFINTKNINISNNYLNQNINPVFDHNFGSKGNDYRIKFSYDMNNKNHQLFSAAQTDDNARFNGGRQFSNLLPHNVTMAPQNMQLNNTQLSNSYNFQQFNAQQLQNMQFMYTQNEHKLRNNQINARSILPLNNQSFMQPNNFQNIAPNNIPQLQIIQPPFRMPISQQNFKAPISTNNQGFLINPQVNKPLSYNLCTSIGHTNIQSNQLVSSDDQKVIRESAFKQSYQSIIPIGQEINKSSFINHSVNSSSQNIKTIAPIGQEVKSSLNQPIVIKSTASFGHPIDLAAIFACANISTTITSSNVSTSAAVITKSNYAKALHSNDSLNLDSSGVIKFQTANNVSTAIGQPTFRMNKGEPSDVEHQKISKEVIESSKVSQLENYFAALKISSLPNYHTQNADGKFRTIVKLPTGGSYYGSFAPTEKQAMDSAAGHALLKLTPQLEENKSDFIKSEVIESNLINIVKDPIFEQSVNKSPNINQIAFSGINFSHQDKNKAITKNSNESAEIRSISLQNFIPTQVLRQQKIVPDEAVTLSLVPDDVSIVTKITKSTLLAEKGQHEKAPETTSTVVVDKKDVKKSPSKKKTTKKSRLAANFSKPQ